MAGPPKAQAEEEGQEEFFDVPDEVADITVAARDSAAVVLRWLEPCDNERPISHYQVCVQPWHLGEAHGPLPPQAAGGPPGHAGSSAAPPGEEEGGDPPHLLLGAARDEVLCPEAAAPGLCNFRLPAPPFARRATAGGPGRGEPLPLGAWVSVRAGNSEGWAGWALPVLVFFRRQGTEGTLFTWGLGEDGRLGRGSEAVKRGVCAEAGAVAGLGGGCIRDVALGSHSAAITGDDHLFVWGTFAVEGGAAAEGAVAGGASEEVDLVVEPTLVPTSFVPESVACGRFVTAVVSAEGGLFAWGPNDMYQCGCHTPTVVRALIRLHLPHRVAVVRVALGEFHGVCLGADGAAFAWGMEQGPEVGLWAAADMGAKLGKLPERAPLNQPEPRRVDVSCCVVDVAAGGFHSALVTRDGRLWTWGKNDKGQLGLGLDVAEASTPRPVEALAGRKVARVSLGGFHSGAVDEGGCLLTWGDNKRGQCGHGTQVVVGKPAVLELAASGPRCADVSCGGFFSIVEAADGQGEDDSGCKRARFYVCGWGKEGCLGFGQPCKRMLTPQPLPDALCGGRWARLHAGMVHVAGLLSVG